MDCFKVSQNGIIFFYSQRGLCAFRAPSSPAVLTLALLQSLILDVYYKFCQKAKGSRYNAHATSLVCKAGSAVRFPREV